MSTPSQALAVIQKEIETRGIAPTAWSTMTEALYPGASPRSVLLVWDYCQARKLDPMKKPVHIVPMKVKVGDDYVWRDTVLPGIYEYRTTAHRTGEYLGHDKPVYGEEITMFGVKAPAWCEFTVYRWNQTAKMKVPYSVRVMFAEVCGTKWKAKNDNTLVANGRWERAPVQMMTKCAEAAALREAFPEEIGGVPTVDEIEDHMPEVIDVTAATPIDAPKPSGFDRVTEGLRDSLEKAFTTLKLSPAQRLTKINEFIPNDATADEGAQRLLDWCKDEYAAQQGRSRAPKPDNGKKAESQHTVANPQAAPAAQTPQGVTSMPNVADSVGRPTGAESLAGASQPADSKQVPAQEIPWGNQGQSKPRDLSEMF